MIKMYNAEVLSKFPVIQHFPFGSLFSWDQDSSAPPPASSVHTSNQPTSQTPSISNSDGRPAQTTRGPSAPGNNISVTAPQTHHQSAADKLPLPMTKAPWATPPDPSSSTTTSTLWTQHRSCTGPSTLPTTIAPWANLPAPNNSNTTAAPWSRQRIGTGQHNLPPTKASWAESGTSAQPAAKSEDDSMKISASKTPDS
ncbi:hypothetical protein BGZ60DRAFT_170955 [Tricladium varicosporioides]|nr:hypothetical protein BGZ60DRAFT_170955 [Hymenoscyphus varicosporioides]